MIHAGIYARISSDRDSDGLAVGRQLVDCEAKAAENGWAVADRYVDSDISAYSGKDRPEYRRLIADIDAGLVNGVIVYNLDRLHRQPRELEEFIDVCRRARIEGNLASCQGYVDLATHHGVLTARLLGAVSAMESDDKSRRIQRKHEEIAQAGRPSGGGSRPYGFEPGGLTIRESEAVVVRECARRALRFVRRFSSVSVARSCADSDGLIIAGHAASATISPLCSRIPPILAEINILRSVCGAQLPPVDEGISRSFKLLVIDRNDSPASARRPHSRTTTASDSRTVRPPGSKPYGREPPPLGRPASAISSCLRWIRLLLSSISIADTAPNSLAVSTP